MKSENFECEITNISELPELTALLGSITSLSKQGLF